MQTPAMKTISPRVRTRQQHFEQKVRWCLKKWHFPDKRENKEPMVGGFCKNVVHGAQS